MSKQNSSKKVRVIFKHNNANDNNVQYGTIIYEQNRSFKKFCDKSIKRRIQEISQNKGIEQQE